jgi:LPXTG-site transpeptidase (sortase) family protein
LRLVLDEDFIDNRMSWPDNSASTAWLAGGEYRLANREPRRFVSVAAPLTTPVRDVVVSARFRKTGGPPGGGYGVILRDERPSERDGVNQSGRYYVVEVGDRGEVGIWRRESDAWVDLLTWTPSEWVNKGQEPNDIEVRATGSRLTLTVNGVQVASQVDDALFDGGVGVFVGGDGNEVALERFVIQIPADATNTAAQSQQQPPHAQQSTVAPQAAAEFLPITRIVIPSISLDSDVVPARLVEREQNTTWDVPAMKVGHAQATAGAGGAGNAVLVGHVDSRGLGNVFHNLDALRVGDQVEVSSGGHTFRYQVGDVRTVQRNDVSVVQPTQTPSVTLITCTGHWLPLVADFTHRLVVRAELASE